MRFSSFLLLQSESRISSVSLHNYTPIHITACVSGKLVRKLLGIKSSRNSD
jgi:hypothetical protein